MGCALASRPFFFGLGLRDGGEIEILWEGKQITLRGHLSAEHMPSLSRWLANGRAGLLYSKQVVHGQVFTGQK
eukprot:600254-Prymnesium_polylepis.1